MSRRTLLAAAVASVTAITVLLIFITNRTDASNRSSPEATGSKQEATGSRQEATGSVQPANGAQKILKFGVTYKYSDGLKLTISKPKQFTPSDSASGPKSEHFVAFTVTIRNETSKIHDPSSFITTMQSKNKEMTEVFDFPNGLMGRPSTSLLPGREVTYEIGYNAIDPSDLILEVKIDYDHSPVIFTS